MNATERDQILRDYELEHARLELEIQELKRKQALNEYEKRLFLDSGAISPAKDWRQSLQNLGLTPNKSLDAH